MLSTGNGRAPSRRRAANTTSALSRRGQALVSETQRSRMLNSAIQVILEHGYAEMSVARITGGAGVSRRTFYDLFQDREDCFLSAFEEAVSRARQPMREAWEDHRGWREQTRAALSALLVFLDREPGLGSLLVVDALKAGPRVQQRRMEVLAQLSGFLHEHGSRARPARELPELTSEGVVGAVLSVIHSRLQLRDGGTMVDLLNPLMGVIVLPYLGHAAAQRERTHPAPVVVASALSQRPEKSAPTNPSWALPMRITYRTLLVLATIKARPGASNRQIADQAGIADQGQISKLLTRLERLGLVENTSEGQPSGEPNAWQLTLRGHQIQRAIQAESADGERQSDSPKESR